MAITSGERFRNWGGRNTSIGGRSLIKDTRMQTSLKLDILPQPDDTTCGPTCLHAVYRYFADDLPLERVIQETGRLDEGGTLAVLLGCHALERGYDALIYTFNLQVFDPTWFAPAAPSLSNRLMAQMAAKDAPKLHTASKAYLEFLRLGGEIRMQDLTSELIRKYLNREVPILTGLSATYLYQEPREFAPRSVELRDGGPRFILDDVRGVPAGHFVVLSGYDKIRRTILVADPLTPNPLAPRHQYEIGIDRVKCAILLGIVTYDANLLIIQPRQNRKGPRSADPHRRR